MLTIIPKTMLNNSIFSFCILPYIHRTYVPTCNKKKLNIIS